jgi:ethanolamine utilization protein EutM
MSSKALGLIEAVGMAAAIEAADAAVKSANVTLLGYENSRGGGMITVKVTGDVGAVKAAIASGSAAAQRVGQVAASHIIPRPNPEIEPLIQNLARGKAAAQPEPAAKSDPAPKPKTTRRPAKPKASATDKKSQPKSKAEPKKSDTSKPDQADSNSSNPADTTPPEPETPSAE